MGEVAALPAAELTAAEIMERVILAGDLSRLTPAERTNYYMSVCRACGLNPLTKPFEYVKLSGREVLYATKGATDQLRQIHGVNLTITDKQISDDLLVVEVQAVDRMGRRDADLGVVPYVYPETFRDRNGNWKPHPKAGRRLEGEDAANALLKATTKAKRRVTLSLCGLGMLDETEVEAVQSAEALAADPPRHVGPPARRIGQGPGHQAGGRPAREPIAVKYPSGNTAQFARTKAGLKMALELIAADPALVLLNLPLLDNAAELPEFADTVAELRARAAEALAPADEAMADWPTALALDRCRATGAGEALADWPGADAGAEEPEPIPYAEPDPEAERMRVHKGGQPADVDAFGLPPVDGAE